jgi:hypothetical protein
MVVGNCWTDLPGNLLGFHVWLQPSETKIQMIKFIYPAEDLQGKWDETTDSDNSKGWKSERYLRYLTNTTTRIPLTTPEINNLLHTPRRTKTHIVFMYLMMSYACTFYSSSQSKITAIYLWTYMVNFGGIIHTSLTIN